jgi:hypothetical protein
MQMSNEAEAELDRALDQVAARRGLIGQAERIVIERNSNGEFVARSSGFLFSTDGARGTYPVEAAGKVEKLASKVTEYLNGLAKPEVTA